MTKNEEENISKEQFVKILKQIISVDKTPDYAYYYKNIKDDIFLNTDGEQPKTGCRWCTPKEICEQYLRDISNKRLGTALKELMK